MQRHALSRALEKVGLKVSDLGLIFAGDLLNLSLIHILIMYSLSSCSKLRSSSCITLITPLMSLSMSFWNIFLSLIHISQSVLLDRQRAGNRSAA